MSDLIKRLNDHGFTIDYDQASRMYKIEKGDTIINVNAYTIEANPIREVVLHLNDLIKQEEKKSSGFDQVKSWGGYNIIQRYPSVYMHELHIKKGGHSSFHSHDSQINTFFVIDGVLEIVEQKDDEFRCCTQLEKTRLEKGSTITLYPGKMHGFYAVTPVKCIEVISGIPDLRDIHRMNEGGICEYNPHW